MLHFSHSIKGASTARRAPSQHCLLLPGAGSIAHHLPAPSPAPRCAALRCAPLASVSCPIAASHLSPRSALMDSGIRMGSGAVHTSTRHPASASSWRQRSPGSCFVTTTLRRPPGLCTCADQRARCSAPTRRAGALDNQAGTAHICACAAFERWPAGASAPPPAVPQPPRLVLAGGRSQIATWSAALPMGVAAQAPRPAAGTLRSPC